MIRAPLGLTLILILALSGCAPDPVHPAADPVFAQQIKSGEAVGDKAKLFVFLGNFTEHNEPSKQIPNPIDWSRDNRYSADLYINDTMVGGINYGECLPIYLPSGSYTISFKSQTRVPMLQNGRLISVKSNEKLYVALDIYYRVPEIVPVPFPLYALAKVTSLDLLPKRRGYHLPTYTGSSRILDTDGPQHIQDLTIVLPNQQAIDRLWPLPDSRR